ncbi:28S rRNA (cytosine-C(5))-methyltransferase [Anopheles funestus]|uniref:28S rRNA (cytosine-C(5))-methyltransferase n=1 Tax=Anopheles funestus TaxID=62324 RepID=UPI0020C69F19|nr:28S rRNA (cytosine-C(5))-methyltransferase [Anopheles funestus]
MAQDTAVKRGHKIPVPSNYRNAAKYVQIAKEEKRNIMPLLEQDKHFRAGRTVVGRVLNNMPIIDLIYNELDLATKEPRIKQWLAKVMIAEVLFGNGRLVGNSRPVESMKAYVDQMHMLLDKHMKDIKKNEEKFKEPRFVRINTNVLNLEGAKHLLAEEQWNLVEEIFPNYQSFLERVKELRNDEYMEDFHFPDMLVFPYEAKWYWSRAQHLHGKFLLQNKACLLPTYLLKPPKKSVVLDMCAAPGLKTTHLASLMKNKGRIYAVERDHTRYTQLCKLVSPYGVIKTIHSDCLKVTHEQVPGVQYILIDPSCSGSGMLQRQLVPEEVDEQRLYKLAGLQYKLLMHALNNFPDVRRIVYSTCSVYVQENEEVVQSVLRHTAHFRLLDARKELGKEWLNVGSPKYRDIGERCLYAKTVDDLTIGMFVAVFERCPEGVENKIYLEHEKQKQSYERCMQKWQRNEQMEQKSKMTEENTVQEPNEEHEGEQEEVQVEKQTSKKRKKARIEENMVEEKKDLLRNEQMEQKPKMTEENTVQEPNEEQEGEQEEVQVEKQTSKKRKKARIEENMVEEEKEQKEAKEKSAFKKRKEKS